MTLTVPGGAITDEGNGPDGADGSGTVAGSGAEPGAATVLSTVADRLEGFLATFEPARVAGEDAAALVVAFARVERLALAGKTLAATRAAEANVHRAGGQRSAGEWLAGATGESVGDAMGTLQLGDALRTQPGVADAFRRGRLSKGKAKAVSGAVGTDPDSEAELLATVESDTLRQVRDRALRIRARRRSAEDEAARDERLHRRRSCRTWTDPEDGSFRLDARLTPTAGARMRSALRRSADRHFEAARRAGAHEAPDAYAADALVALVCGDDRGGAGGSGRSAAPRGTGESDDADGADDRPGARRSPTGGRNDSVHVRIDLDALRRGHVGDGQVCEIPGVGPISVERAREIMGDALVRLVITDGVDVPSICNLRRHIPAPVAAALLERDPTCVVPGCDRTEPLEIDHWKVDFADDGPTQWWNLARLCPHHHDLKTRGRFRLEGGPGHWRFVRNDGGRSGREDAAQNPERPTGGRKPAHEPATHPPDPDPAPPLFPHTE